MVQAVILAGGRGTRLSPLTDEIPKPLVRVNDKPFLEHQLLLLKKHGIRRILLLVSYLGRMIEEYFKDGARLELNITYSYEDKPLGTGGALANAGQKLEERFLLLNGDTFLDIEYQDVVRYSEAVNRIGLIVAYRNSKENLKSNMSLDSKNRVTGYSKQGSLDMRFVDAGVAMYKREVLEFIPGERVVSLEQEVFPKLIARQELWGYPCEQPFYDIGTFQGLEAARRVLG